MTLIIESTILDSMKTSIDWIEVRILQKSLKESLEVCQGSLKDSTSARSNGFTMNLIIESIILDSMKTSINWIEVRILQES